LWENTYGIDVVTTVTTAMLKGVWALWDNNDDVYVVTTVATVILLRNFEPQYLLVGIYYLRFSHHS
jgi:hypothetical protein